MEPSASQVSSEPSRPENSNVENFGRILATQPANQLVRMLSPPSSQAWGGMASVCEC